MDHNSTLPIRNPPSATRISQPEIEKRTMRRPTLNELPPPPSERTGWPWTEASPQLPDMTPDGRPWPRVSIVTPSYNQAQFIEETIRSVLLQGYPDQEYIIIDGGSTDGSADIIRKYADHLTFWVSEPDQGQAHALQKGFARATGEIVAYLNSDDVYLPNTLTTIVTRFLLDPELALVHGDAVLIDAAGQTVGHKQGLSGDYLRFFLELVNPILQPSAFMRRNALEKAGGIDPAFHMAMDYDLWCRIGLRGMKIEHIPQFLSRFRIHAKSKTRQHVLEFAKERWRVLEKCLADPYLAPKLAPHRRRLWAVGHLHLASAHWLCGNQKEAYSHFRQAITMAPRLIMTQRGLSLLTRMLLRRRSFRGRFFEHVA